MTRKGRILLLTPNLRGVKDGLNRIQPPLGPMMLGAVLRRNGHDVFFHDTALEGWDRRVDVDERTVAIGQSDDEIRGAVQRYDPDIVGISALFSNMMESAHRIAGLAKSVSPRIRVVLGGNHISNAVADALYFRDRPESSLAAGLPEMTDPHIDFAMRGEVELAFATLVDRLMAGADVSDVPGLVMRRDGTRDEYRINAAPAANPALSDLPHPARDLVNMESYFSIGAFHSAKSRSNRVLNVMASRGCPEQCTFCTTPATWGATVRWRTVDDIIGEIKAATDRYRIGELQFEDDTITARKPNLLRLCRELAPLGLPWCTPNGTKTNYHLATQPELYQAMADSGCYQITLACESGSQRVLDEIIRKHLRVEEIRPAIENAKKAGMLVHTFWILGYPGETYEEMRHTVEFAMASGADSFSFSILSPLPGTAIYRQVVRENLWWPGRSVRDLLYRTSLVRVDGFESPERFERFVTDTNIQANRLLEQRDPERFRLKYGPNPSEQMLVRQT